MWGLPLLLVGRSNEVALRHKHRRQNNVREFWSGVRFRRKLDDERRVRASVLLGLLMLMAGRHIIRLAI